MNKQNIFITIIAIIICLAINPIIMFIHTTIYWISKIEFEYPLTMYLMYGYFPLIISGTYIAFTKTKSPVMICIIVGVFNALYKISFENLLSNNQNYFILEYSKVIILLNLTFLSVLIVTGTYSIISYLRTNFL